MFRQGNILNLINNVNVLLISICNGLILQQGNQGRSGEQTKRFVRPAHNHVSSGADVIESAGGGAGKDVLI
jgi:hypothetical protein